MYVYVTVFVLGSIIGSFLNVCIYRIPRHKSIVFPSSRCPGCNSPINAIDNIPILSYIFLGGKCRECKQKISIRYPFVEALNASMYVAVVWRFGLHWYSLICMVFVSAMIVITFIDLDFQIIPDSITLPGIGIGLICSIFVLIDPYNRSDSIGIINSVTGVLIGGGSFYLIAVLSRGGMGGGDIKMMGMVGAFLGWKGVLMTTFVASLTGSVIGIFLMVLKGKGRKAKVPFGPFLALGSLISLFWGQELLRLYLTIS